MQKYYICTTGVAKGPFLLEDLYEIEIDEQDLIWGSKWRRARYAHEIRELKKHFNKEWAQENSGKTWMQSIKPASIGLAVFGAILLTMLFYWFFVV